MQSIWQSLKAPFLVLAPLEGVTDTVFRRIVASCARPDVFFTEFTSADGFCSVGKERVAENFRYTVEEQPLIAQIFGNDPKTMFETAREISTMGFAGIDINMGCPVREVTKTGCGAAMIKTPELAKTIIEAVQKGSGEVPVSVKTRIGFNSIVTDDWISFLLGLNLDALTVHCRTARELSKVPAHWDEIRKGVEIRNRMGVSTKIIGNGDVKNAKDAMEKHIAYGVDGVMMGRAVFADMWAFDKSDTPHETTTKELLDLMERHIRMFDAEWGKKKNYAILKKFFKIYINGFDGASEVRDQCMKTNTVEEVLHILEDLRVQLGISK
ncbi:MAG: tRNA-dihydrouridine synthase [Patescibacteria group bacterium]